MGTILSSVWQYASTIVLDRLIILRWELQHRFGCKLSICTEIDSNSFRAHSIEPNCHNKLSQFPYKAVSPLQAIQHPSMLHALLRSGGTVQTGAAQAYIAASSQTELTKLLEIIEKAAWHQICFTWFDWLTDEHSRSSHVVRQTIVLVYRQLVELSALNETYCNYTSSNAVTHAALYFSLGAEIAQFNQSEKNNVSLRALLFILRYCAATSPKVGPSLIVFCYRNEEKQAFLITHTHENVNGKILFMLFFFEIGNRKYKT